MPLYLVTPFDRDHDPMAAPDAAEGAPAPGINRSPPFRRLCRFGADLCYILIKAGAFLGAIYLAVLGLPLLFFLALVGGDLSLLFAQLGNLSAHYLAATHAAQASFDATIKLGLFGLATLIAIWRLPRFLDVVAATLDRPGDDV